ncbi:MAG: hypothetical protein H6Q57_1085 [Geobacteraceae bacterium]|nr:hypothetical protein [Geobacteraceae bacterium]
MKIPALKPETEGRFPTIAEFLQGIVCKETYGSFRYWQRGVKVPYCYLMCKNS